MKAGGASFAQNLHSVARLEELQASNDVRLEYPVLDRKMRAEPKAHTALMPSMRENHGLLTVAESCPAAETMRFVAANTA